MALVYHRVNSDTLWQTQGTIVDLKNTYATVMLEASERIKMMVFFLSSVQFNGSLGLSLGCGINTIAPFFFKGRPVWISGWSS